jgi:hypothetical protein
MGNFIRKYGGAAREGVGPRGIVWNKIPRDEIASDPGRGFGFFDHFLRPVRSTTTSWWGTVTRYGTGTLNKSGEEGGVLQLRPHTSSQTDTGIQIQGDTVFVADTDTYLAFGARVKFTTAAAVTACVGLLVADSDIAANIATVADGINFRLTAAADINYMVHTAASTEVDTGDNASDDTYVDLEMLVQGERQVLIYVDGVETASVTTGIPVDTPMAFSLASEATTDANTYMSVDWAYCYSWLRTGRLQ